MLIAGPTASGKTALALTLAERLGAEIVNADSMQVYADLEILSARPTPDDTARAAHHLFGHVDAGEVYSVGRWLRDACAALDEIASRGARAVVVGGTGLYFKALTEGLADVPQPGPEAEAAALGILREGGVEALRAEAQTRDPDATAKVLGADKQRLLRIVAVALGTGAPLSALRRDTAPPLPRAAWRGIALEPDRDVLYARIDARAAWMLDHGAIAEARALIGRGLSPELPAMKALGVSTLGDLDAGRINRDDALERLARDTRRYAKRQSTWFRNQQVEWPRVAAADVDAIVAALAPEGVPGR